MDNGRYRVLFVEDERRSAADVLTALRQDGYTVDAVEDERSAQAALAARTYNLVLLDVGLPQTTALQLLQQVRKELPGTPVILMTNCATVENAVEAMKAGAFDYLTKPLDVSRLRLLVAQAVESREMAAGNHGRACSGVAIDGPDRPTSPPSHDSIAAACEVRPGMTISECEKLLIKQTLMYATTNREQAAKLLGISRRALQYKLKSYGLLSPKRVPVVAETPAHR